MKGLLHRILKCGRVGSPDSVPISPAINSPGRTLIVEAPDGRIWVLPWRDFVVAHLDRYGDLELITIHFARYTCEILGRNLDALLSATADFRLPQLRCSECGREAPDRNEPFVTAIEVR